MADTAATTLLRPKILVIDDSKLIRVAAEKILSIDYEVLLANDGDDGWSIIQQDPEIQVVFSDLTMPRVDGFSLLKQVRNSDSDRIANLPLIIMTTDADDESRRETALQLGATDFISKPFNSIDLKARAKAHASSEQYTRELHSKNLELQRNASKDALTGLSNRSYLLERLWQDRAYSARHRACLSILRLDIDDFNSIFVQYGKESSQEVVKAIARAIRENLRQEDTAARIGLSTFVVVIPGASPVESQTIAKTIQDSVNSVALKFNDEEFHFSLSVAIRIPNPDQSPSVDALLEELEELMQNTLEQGPQRVVVKLDEFDVDEAVSQSEQNGSPPGLEASLQLIKAGRGEVVAPHLEQLVESVLPLLAASDEKLKEKIRKAIE